MYKIEELLKNDYTKWKDRDYIFEKINGKFEPITFGNFIENSLYFADYLLSKDLKGKKIMLFGENSIKWMIADVAIMSYVGECVTVSKERKFEEIDYSVNFLGISCIIYSASKKEIIEKIKKKYSDILYICIDEDFEDAIRLGKEINSKKQDKFDFEPKDPNTCSKIIFTSGTTSRPKAVMLSLKNIFAGFDELYKRTNINETDISYLFLPLSHTYADVYNFIYSLISGHKIYLASSSQAIGQELLETNPTIFCAVPLIYYKLYESYQENISKAFGNNIKHLFCGGALFEPKIRKIYKESGLNMMEAYALTETASSLSIEYPNKDDFESVGTIFDNVEVKIINPDKNGVGEIACKGDNVFLGYAGDKNATKSVFTDDGYFLTGDLGYVDEKRRLYITGRKKKILVLPNGEKIIVSKVVEKIKNLDLENNINYVKLTIVNGKVNCDLYVKFIKDYKDLIDKYNSEAVKYEKIDDYKIIVDSIDKRLKQ